MEETIEIKRPKLLLADDSITVRKVVELTFAEEGVDVFAVGDGDAAMQKFVEIEPDIVLVDVNMPDPDGYHICEMIKQDESTKDIPVLLLVGSFEPFDTAEAERVGADGFLTKPFQSVRELVGKVTELLGEQETFTPPPAETADIESLYTSSVSETYRGPDSTTDAFLGDAGMDDDLIDTSFLGDGPEQEPFADAKPDETFQGYDWMAQQVDTPEPEAASVGLEEEPRRVTAIEMYESELETPPDTQQAEHEREPERETAFDMYEPELELESVPPDPPAVEAQPENSNSFEIVANEFADTLEIGEKHAEALNNGFATEEAQAEDPISFERVADEFDDTVDIEEPQPEPPKSSPAEEAHLENTSSFERVDDEFEDTLGVDEPQSEPAQNDAATAESLSYEPSVEFIEIIAQRVIDRLSDKAIRDIARETVPRITEKLIREALEETKKQQS